LKLRVRKFIETELEGDLEVTYLVTGPYSDLFLGREVEGMRRRGVLMLKDAKRWCWVMGSGMLVLRP
jgi:hypothetical protein